MFYVGQKVVCVNADDQIPDAKTTGDWESPLVKGKVYIISQVPAIHFFYPEVPCLRVEGVVRFPDYPLAQSRFQPLEEKKTDISVFTEILNTTKIPEDIS